MKKTLMSNPSLNQYVEQNFPIIDNKVEVTTFLGKDGNHSKYLCNYFKVEVVKDCDGFVSFILKGESASYEDVWIMRTDDFNKAYSLKNRLDELCGRNVNNKTKMHCYGSLQREKLYWDGK